MAELDTQNVNQLLGKAKSGDAAAGSELVDLLYSDLRRLAASYLRSESPGHTLQPTAVVHELWIKIFGHSFPDVQDKGHLYALCAQAMRRLLVDHARAKGADKRGGGFEHVHLERLDLPEEAGSFEQYAALDQALEEFERFAPSEARVVELRYFCGLTLEEAADALGLSREQVKAAWRRARAWLAARIG
jgi:RNA polymerase sigma-70 factor, ECF subfamily